VCECGYSLVTVSTAFGTLLINGVFIPFQNTVMTAEAKKLNRSQKVPWEEVQEFSNGLRVASGSVLQEMQRQAKEAVAGLHDINTGVSLVFRNAEAIVASLPGADDYDRIEGAPGPLKALLKSVNLLSSRLRLASLAANPESASYGQRRGTPVYRVFHLMVRLFEQEATRKGIDLRMTGSSYNAPMLYDSFETIPLVLIDNAIKYSISTRDITVRVDDLGTGGCRACVESWGPIVPESQQELIFSRGFRSPNAVRVASSGSGLGLYIARIAAIANGCALSYSVRAVRGSEGYNCFALDVQGSREV
jgi:K+-sensing histidine kinase KdpD